MRRRLRTGVQRGLHGRGAVHNIHADTDADTDRYTDRHVHPDRYEHLHINADAHADADTHRDTYGNIDPDMDGHGHGNEHTKPDADGHRHQDLRTDTDPNARAERLLPVRAQPALQCAAERHLQPWRPGRLQRSLRRSGIVRHLHGDPDVHPNANVNGNGHADANIHIDPSQYPDGHSQRHAKRDGDALDDRDTDTGRDPYSHCNAHTRTERLLSVRPQPALQCAAERPVQSRRRAGQERCLRR
jgi:hypothetical protein